MRAYHNRIGVDAVDDAPLCSGILDPQLSDSATDTRHRPRCRQSKQIAQLQPTQKEPGFSARFRRPRRGLHLTVEPDDRFI